MVGPEDASAPYYLIIGIEKCSRPTIRIKFIEFVYRRV